MRIIRAILLLAISLLLCGPSARAQVFELDEFSIPIIADEETTGGEFSLSGAVLTQEKEEMIGGEFSLVGEFVAVQPADPLALRERLEDGIVVITWPATADGYDLESTSSIGGQAVWQTVTSERSTAAGQIVVRLPPSFGVQFFRLRQP